jgi:uncharacterized membrane protein
MFGFVATVAVAVLVLTVLLPLVTFARLVALSREVERLRARLDRLERGARAAPGVVPPHAVTAPARGAEAPTVDTGDLPGPAAIRSSAEPAAIAGDAVPLAGAAAPTVAAAPPWQPGSARPAAAPAGTTLRRPRRAPPEPWLEAAIGGRLLLYVGTAAVVLGIAFFLKYAFDRAWITEWMRVALGAAAGVALVGGGLRFARAGFAAYGQILSGGGLAVLYLSVYAAFDFYGLIGRVPAFGLLLGITVAAAVLSDRSRSQGMAFMAVVGGFLTPFLVGGPGDAQVTLFSYVALLVAGTTLLAHRQQWPLLNVASFALTVFTVAAWASVHYTPAKYLRTQLFLTLFVAMFLVALRDAWRARDAAPAARLRGRPPDARSSAALVLLLAPVLYHVASLAVLFPHTAPLLVYLIAITVAGVAWTVRTDRAAWAPLLWATAMLPFFGWTGQVTPRWVGAGAVTLLAIFVAHLLAQFDRLDRQGTRLGPPDLLLLHLNGLGLLLGFYLLLEDVALAWIPAVGAALVLLHGGITWRLQARDPVAALHGLAVTFALLAATVALEFDGPWLTAALAAEGAAVMWVGLRARAEWFRTAGIVLFAVAAGRWLLLSVAQTPASFRLVFNEAFLVGAWVIGLLYVGAWLHREPERRTSVAAMLVTASVLTVVLLTSQNASYWELQRPVHADATFAQSLSLSVLWLLYAAVLIVVGIARAYPPLRYTAMGLFGLTIVKVFTIDMAGLEGIYRILGLVILGLVLLGVSFLYQRVVRSQETPPEEEPAG